jgi:hypothetical protein
MADFGVTEAIAVVGLLGSVAGGVTAGVAAKQSGDYQAAVARNNATIADQKASYDAQAAAAQEHDQDLRSRQELGKIGAIQAASGLDVNSGSQKDVITGSQQLARLNTLRTGTAGAFAVASDKNQSQDFTSQAQFAQATGDNALTASLISTGASVADKWSMYKSKGIF